MNKEDLQRIVFRYLKKIRKYIKQIQPDFDEELIHQFRVNYKKLRAFLRILSAANNNRNTGLSRKIKRAYHIAGSIRDLKLQKKRVLNATKGHYRRPLEYTSLIQRKVRNFEKELLPILSKKPLRKSRKKIMTILPRSYHPADYARFSEQKYRAFKTMLLGNISDNQMHSVRKILKDLFFSNRNIGKWTGWRSEPWKIKSDTNLNNLLEELGDFQDRRTAISLLTADWISMLTARERKFMTDLRSEWIQEKLIMKRRLIRKLKADIISE